MQYVNNFEDAVNWTFSEIEPHTRNPRLLTYTRPELVNSTIETTQAVEGQMANTDGEHRWRKSESTRDPKYFSARAMMDHRPFEALLVQEGLIDNHPFTAVF